jgi:hypothetical protein
MEVFWFRVIFGGVKHVSAFRISSVASRLGVSIGGQTSHPK